MQFENIGMWVIIELESIFESIKCHFGYLKTCLYLA